MTKYIDVDKKIEEINRGIDSITRLIENRPYDEEAKLILREHKFCLYELERTPIVSEWIDVNERLPEDNDPEYYQTVILALKNKKVVTGCYRTHDGEWWGDLTDGEYSKITGEVTHWMPLPEPPKEEN